MKKLSFIFSLSLLVKVANAACPDGKTYPVHFTFDDGPHTVLTPKVLDVLKEEKVPATFFVKRGKGASYLFCIGKTFCWWERECSQ
jgi:peptidoglycan/xylan/chitin deacetylase (PgdA/CDA1 family)